jgi:ATP-dependent Clp protease protease subunit
MRRYESREARFSSRVMLNYVATQLPETFSVVAAADGASTEILLYDEIGFWGVTAKDFVLALAEAGDGPITLRINSPGGDVFDGLAIYNALRARTAPVNVVIDGLAASAASFIAMAGTSVSMAEASMMMIHNAWGICVGDRNDMLDMAGVMEKIDGQLAGIYAAKSGKSAKDIGAMMDAETWFTAGEAKDAGMCDRVTEPPKAKPIDPANRLASRLRAVAPAPRAAATTPEWMCSAAEDLPIDKDKSWDGPAAAERMLDAAGFNGDSPDPAKAKRGFLAWDHHNPKLKGSYKLPFADLIGGELKAVESVIDAAASRLPDTDIPDAVKSRARAVIDAYEKRAGSDADDTSNQAASAIEARKRRLRVAEAEAA